jgi:hypothetical protein
MRHGFLRSPLGTVKMGRPCYTRALYGTEAISYIGLHLWVLYMVVHLTPMRNTSYMGAHLMGMYLKYRRAAARGIIHTIFGLAHAIQAFDRTGLKAYFTNEDRWAGPAEPCACKAVTAAGRAGEAAAGRVMVEAVGMIASTVRQLAQDPAPLDRSGGARQDQDRLGQDGQDKQIDRLGQTDRHGQDGQARAGQAGQW